MSDQIGIPESPFVTVEEGARLARFDTCEHPEVAFRQWAAREGIPARRRGRSGRKLLFRRADIEAALISA